MQIRLVQEFCDQGSLRDKLNDLVFLKPAAPLAAATASNTGPDRHMSMPGNSPVAGASADVATPGRVGSARNLPTGRSSVSVTSEHVNRVKGSAGMVRMQGWPFAVHCAGYRCPLD